ncbi:MAG TPA: segregation/condensation protein A [Clostridia bacterium]|nr:segregation/condensation protein A [Clostridia bacterium]
MTCNFKLEVFEGPLDLLLHLIQKQEIDIYDIPVAEITDQYLSHLWALEQLDLEVTSEFLVMAATLLSIKAKMLLPKPPLQDESIEEAIDPREELVLRLLEYKKYKGAAEKFREMEKSRSHLFFRPVDPDSLVKYYSTINPLEEVNVLDLLDYFLQALSKAALPEPVHEIQQEEITVNQQMRLIQDLLDSRPAGLNFFDLFPHSTTRGRIVVTFLALLELMRLQKVLVCQQKVFSEIVIFPFPKSC